MRRAERGQTLLEVLVALSAVLIILSAITTIVLSSLNQSVSSNNTSLATQYAQEGMELATVTTALSVGKTYCLGSDKEFIEEECVTANIGEFRRQVSISSDAARCSTLRKITISVSWTDAKCKDSPFCHAVPLTTCAK